MTSNTIKDLLTEGQSVWQDDISRDMLQSGLLQKRIDDIGVRGVTSNPSIFQKAIAAGTAYDTDIEHLLGENLAVEDVFQRLAVKDIQDACDLFRPIYDSSNGEDGFVSIEVLPSLARDTEGTLANARVLWEAVDRPNLMVKVPGTTEGAPAIEQLLFEGMNINITLLFSLANYERVAVAYISALQRRHDAGLPIDRIASVASFFVSRVDTAADKALDANGSDLASSLKGKVAVANAQLAYERFQMLFGNDTFRKLAAEGAKAQRPLWASTGTKNPEYSDVLYVETLIGPDTVNTMPVATIEAFLDHGTVARTVDTDYAAAHQVATDLKSIGISLDEITAQLENDGIDLFVKSYDDLLAGVDAKRAQLAHVAGDNSATAHGNSPATGRTVPGRVENCGMSESVHGKRHVGVVGLAVMGENLALNIERNGFAPAVYNRTAARTEEFLATRAKGTEILGTFSLEEFAASLERPRRVLLMVKAGAPVDAVIEEIAPYLEEGDILIDGGNSLFTDTERRSTDLADRGFQFVGMGVSGGEEGALWGPSLMPGGPAEAYEALRPILEAIAAKSEYGSCVTHIGPGGAGHYVKMVHNGIEYGDMQLIAEVTHIMRRALGMSMPEIGDVFERWNTGKLESFLIEISAKVAKHIDPETGKPLVDVILDKAEQKGTGRWTSINSYELATPIPVIDAAVIARAISSMKPQREYASTILIGPGSDGYQVPETPDRNATIDALENALYFSKISSYAQGMALLKVASDTYEWNLNFAEVARIWTAGCIIRARLLAPIMDAYKRNPELGNLMFDPFFTQEINGTMADVRKAIHTALDFGIPTPATSAALNYVDSYRSAILPADMIQGLRDYFGAHTYQRRDREGTFHTEWMELETT
jgi:6-phosphogluconate dehydrogenase